MPCYRAFMTNVNGERTSPAPAPGRRTMDDNRMLVPTEASPLRSQHSGRRGDDPTGGRRHDVAIDVQTPYPANYEAAVQQVVRENESGDLPPLRTRIDNIQQYDVVFLGFPTWGMQLPPLSRRSCGTTA